MQHPNSRRPQNGGRSSSRANTQTGGRPQNSQTPQRPNAAARRRRKKAQQRKLLLLMSAAILLIIAIVVTIIVMIVNNKKKAQTSEPPSLIASSLPEPSSTPSSTPEPVATRDKTPYDEEDMPDLFNFENPIPAGYEYDLIEVGSGQQMQRQAGEAFKDMYRAAKEEGIELTPVSGYRTHERQKNNYNASIQRYLDQGLSQDAAVSRTQQYYAIPGTSEHEAGVAMDIGWIEDSFETSAAFEWLQKNAETYGFIMRYASDTYDITRINYEPWHYRYVGANHAEKINELGITLEEYHELMFGMG